MSSSTENGFCAEASSRITLSSVRITLWSTDSGSSAGEAVVWRSVTSTWPRPVVASAAICGSSPRDRARRARSAPGCSTPPLRGLKPRYDIELLSGRANGSGGRCRDRCVAEMRMKLFELPHLAERAPAQVTAPRPPQIRVGDRNEAARRVEARGQLMGQALVLDEAVLACRAGRRFVEALGVQFALFQTRDLGANQCRPVCECCRTVVCPDRYLLEMRC